MCLLGVHNELRRVLKVKVFLRGPARTQGPLEVVIETRKTPGRANLTFFKIHESRNEINDFAIHSGPVPQSKRGGLVRGLLRKEKECTLLDSFGKLPIWGTRRCQRREREKGGIQACTGKVRGVLAIWGGGPPKEVY